MTAFEPKNPDYCAAVASMFDSQPAMRTLGIALVRVAPGEAELAMDHSPTLTQQHGFVHAGIITAGLDNACGVAAFTLMPREAGILTVEFKTSLLAPARGARASSSGPRQSSRAARSLLARPRRSRGRTV
jgi:uncharacterized protein (TIGR00369 family)